jgi:preprotein translocase subunit SecE
MADQPDKSSKKRRVRDPETFRERATKASEEQSQTKVVAKSRGFLSNKVFKPIFRPIKKGFVDFFNLPGVVYLKPPLRILAIVLGFKYFRDSWRELKLVTWPGWKESRRLTYAVLVFATIFGSAVAGIDWGLGKIFKHILLK